MMNSKEIFEEYTKASNKMKYIKEKAKALGVYDSDIICELLKSGYKFEELKRANKGTYNAGMKKYEKWKENGSPEDEDADVLERIEVEQAEPVPSTQVDEIEHLNKRLMDRIDELQLSVNELTEKNEQLEHEKCRLEADTRKYQIKVHELTEQLELEKADSESDTRTLKEAWNECEELRSKLQKAERYILNRIYEDCEEEVTNDHRD